MLSPSSLSQASLIPLGRFGSLLFRERSRRQISLSELSRLTGGRWMPDLLLDIERGLVTLDDEDVQRVGNAYGVAFNVGPVDRHHRLVLDRTTSSEFVRRHGHTPSTEDFIHRFLVVARLVGLDVMTRGFGLDALAEALDITTVGAFELVAAHYDDGQAMIDAGAAVLSEQVNVPAVGLLVGDTRNGTLVLGPAPW